MTEPLEPEGWDSHAGRPDGEVAPGANTLGMAIFLVSLSVLFLASIAGYLVVRLRADSWAPDDGSGFPLGLWASTLIIVGCSVAIHAALSAVRAGRQAALVRSLAITLVLGLVFLGLQTANWIDLHRSGVTGRESLYGFTFYLFTALHAVHVVGGLIPLGVATARARAGAYSSLSHGGVLHCAMYWHFLDVVWVILFAIILLG